MKMDDLPIVLKKLNVSSNEQVLALYAKAQFVEGPPLFQRIVSPDEF